MGITNERREEASHILRKAGYSEAEISALHSEAPKTRKNKKRAEYIRTVLDYINLHGAFPKKEHYTKFPQCPENSSSQRELNNRIRKKYSKDTGKAFKKDDGKFKLENFDANPEHKKALNKLRKAGFIDLVKEGTTCDDKIHNYLLSHTDVGEVGTKIFQYRIKEEKK